jgi:SAM-dependent methyltransferase
VSCPRCGAATTDPWPSQATLERAYSTWYRPPGGRFGGPGDAIFRRARAAFARRIDRIAPAGPILDVGAGEGTLIDALRARGRDAMGLELLSSRPDIREGSIEDVKESGFAAIVFWHSLEHLPRPGAAVTRAAELLSTNGVLAIAVPNLDSIQARTFGDRWLHLDFPRHLVHLPASTLIRGLEEQGMKVTRTSYLRGGQVTFGWLHGLVGRLPGEPSLYGAIRRADAWDDPPTPARRAYALGAGALLAPIAVAAAGVEVVRGRGGSVYVEARRA